MTDILVSIGIGVVIFIVISAFFLLTSGIKHTTIYEGKNYDYIEEGKEFSALKANIKSLVFMIAAISAYYILKDVPVAKAIFFSVIISIAAAVLLLVVCYLMFERGTTKKEGDDNTDYALMLEMFINNIATSVYAVLIINLIGWI